MAVPVTFFYPYPEEIEQAPTLDLHDPAFWSHEGKERRRAWLLQTCCWLTHFGYDARLAATLPAEGIVVLMPEPEQQAAFQAQFQPARHRNILVATIRADVIGFRSPLGDADIVQNGRFADDRRTFFVPHWPQPGLIPRDATRDVRIEHIVFKGGFGSLQKDFRSDAWYEALEARGLTFEIASAETQGTIPRWHDYRTADLSLAVRPDLGDGGLRCEKPASKLINAWHAGVPSLLGPEYAYRELRQSPLDYIEIETPRDALHAIDALRSDPVRYRAMVRHARRRARSFTPAAIAKRWAQVLYDDLPRLARTRPVQWTRAMPLSARRAVNFVLMPPAPFELRKQLGHVWRQTTRP
ncbi:glycosyltransferase [Salisaeta longa]|uniref:glycosyltransferase n=1 Tax=Salisaeta longa TaxID=503170 RepID=UPI0003B34D79|nr:glycosyltransferase family 1 protein [Salisaeta longa]